ncbi:MAG: signal peptidase [Verrucomicrobiota bacterium]|jgi:signal peptidase II|nr:signal peptidase II [Opitutaceae bacterium]
MPAAPETAPTGRPDGGPARSPRRTRLAAYRRFWRLAAIVLVLDQVTKLLVVAGLPYNALHSHAPGLGVDVIPGFLHLIHVGNTGAAWSILSGRSLLLAGLAAVTLAGIYFWRHSLGLREPAGQNAFGLLCGGVAGNLIDRLAHGHVIDFLDLHFGSYIYPTFNVADSGICVGVGLYLWHSLRAPSPDGR